MICRIHDWVMNLRSRVIGGGDGQDDEEEVLIEQENDEEEEVTEKKGVAGDERNIAVLLFLYVLQVDIWPILSRDFSCISFSGHPSWLGRRHTAHTHQQKCLFL